MTRQDDVSALVGELRAVTCHQCETDALFVAKLCHAAADALERLSKPVVDEGRLEAMALAMCASYGEDPRGTQVSFTDGEMHSVTFLDRAKHGLRAALSARE